MALNWPIFFLLQPWNILHEYTYTCTYFIQPPAPSGPQHQNSRGRGEAGLSQGAGMALSSWSWLELVGAGWSQLELVPLTLTWLLPTWRKLLLTQGQQPDRPQGWGEQQPFVSWCQRALSTSPRGPPVAAREWWGEWGRDRDSWHQRRRVCASNAFCLEARGVKVSMRMKEQ